ncbi:MAG: serine hydrolase domain-containing protein [Flavobacteriaceae bacterium]|nr:serine hydrolase domain-containing protein [Flavobacteriaceae bacterium]
MNFIKFIFLLTFTFSHAGSPFASTHASINANLFPAEIEHEDVTRSPYKELYEEIDRINLGATNPRFNGSVLVGYKGKVIYEKAFGQANRAIGKPNSLQLPTQVASITKTFTGTAVMWLQEKGFLNIEDKVSKYIWEFPYENITIEQLLAHTSGLSDYIQFSGRYWSSSQPMYNDEVLNQFTTYKFKLKFTPGTRFDYSNSNYAFLGLIIERVSGMQYKDFMKKYIFEPLHMNNSYVFDPADEYAFTHARSYNANFTEWKNTHQDGVYGDKGIFTTAQDLFKWDQALYSNNFLNSETLNNTFSPRQPWNASKNYALGWRMRTFPNGEKFAYHTGWWHGYQGIFSRYMKDEFTIVILSNRYISGITKNSELIYDTASKYLNLTDLKGNLQKEIQLEEDHAGEEIQIVMR